MMRFLKLINCMIVFCMANTLIHAQSLFPELFNPQDSTGLYSMNIELGSNHFSGLLLLKKTDDSTIRLVMNSEMGPTLLDMDLLPSAYKVRYAFPKLSNKRILKTFYEDFGALCGIIIRNKCPATTSCGGVTSLSFDMEKKVKLIYTSDSLTHLFVSGRFEEKNTVRSSFYYVLAPGTSKVDSIKLEHFRFAMTISLTKI